MLARDAEHEILPQCRTDGLGVLVYSPLAGGLLTGSNDTEGARGRRAVGALPTIDPELRRSALEALDTIATARGASMLQIALAWVVAQPGVTSAIVGARTVEQLDENLAAADLVLEPDELAQLDVATALEPIYPTTVDRKWSFLEPGVDDESRSR